MSLSDLVDRASDGGGVACGDSTAPGPLTADTGTSEEAAPPRTSRFAPFGLVFALILTNLHQLAPDTTSDSLYPLSLARDVVEHRLRVRGWVLPPALYLFPDVVVTTLLYTPGRNARVAYFGHGFVFALWFAALAWILVRRLGTGLSAATQRWVWASGIGLLCSASLIDKGLFIMLQMFLSGAFHDGAFLVSLTVVLMVSSHTLSARRTRLQLGAAAVLLGLGTFSDPLVVAQGVLPGLVICWLRRRQSHGGAGAAWPVVLTVSPLVGLLGNRLLTRGGFTLSTAGSPRPSLAGVAAFVRDVPTLAFGYPIWAGFAAVSVVAITDLVRGGRRTANPRLAAPTQQRLGPLCCGLGAMVVAGTGVTALTGYTNIDHIRRDLPLLVFPLLLGPLVIARALARRRRNHTGVWATVCCVCVAASVAGSLSAAQATDTPWLAPDLPYYQHQRCLDDLHRQGRIGSGLGDYWAARLFTETSRSRLVIAPIDMDGTFLAAIANPDVVLAPASNPNGIASGPLNFVIPNRLPEAVLERELGVPATRLRCAGMPVWVYAPGALSAKLARLRRQAQRLPGTRRPLTIGRSADRTSQGLPSPLR